MRKFLFTIFLCLLACVSAFSQEISGIDVSRHQGTINWMKLKENNDISFVYIKATEGSSYTDPKFTYNVTEARKAGMKVGAYLFFRTTSPAKKQFEHFKSVCPKDSVDLIPMIDVENCGKWSRSKIQNAIKEIAILMENYYGKKPIIYSIQHIYNHFLAPDFSNYLVYIGKYNNQEPVLEGERHYNIWQFTEKGQLTGIDKKVDECRFHPDNSIEDLTL